ncbi:MAG: hypothetical protein LUD57_01255 [Ruminococcus sp.]|nr:hypothetical protein [Ruminococcus sp.]
MAVKTSFSLDGKKITRKTLQDLIGDEAVKRLIDHAKGNSTVDYFINGQKLTIEFTETQTAE